MRFVLFLAASVFFGGTAMGAPVVLYDFEHDTEGWTAEWGLSEPMDIAAGRSRSGEKSLLVTHRFAPKKEAIGFRVVYDPPRNFTMDPGFAGFSVWVYLPSADGWEAQMYVHSGEEWKWGESPLQKQLQPGWHRLMIGTDKIADPSLVRSIGIQIKNFKHQRVMKINVDRVEALYNP